MTQARRTPRAHGWEFAARFRRHAFGWRSAPAIERVRQAVAEIKAVARRDAVLAAEGAVAFLERVSPALEQVDSSSGAIGTAVNQAIAKLVPMMGRLAGDQPMSERASDCVAPRIDNMPDRAALQVDDRLCPSRR
jgi:hypothetical protein